MARFSALGAAGAVGMLGKKRPFRKAAPYFAGEHVKDYWAECPREQTDIRRHVSRRSPLSNHPRSLMLTIFTFDIQDGMAFGEPTRVKPTQHFFGEA